jgi:hypothetical protein
LFYIIGNKCTEEMDQQAIAILDVHKASFEEKYLGLPVPEGG